MNSQDIDVYAVMKSGVYLYNPKKHSLEFITDGDHRALVAGSQEKFAVAPVFCVLVSDISRFTRVRSLQNLSGQQKMRESCHKIFQFSAHLLDLQPGHAPLWTRKNYAKFLN